LSSDLAFKHKICVFVYIQMKFINSYRTLTVYYSNHFSFPEMPFRTKAVYVKSIKETNEPNTGFENMALIVKKITLDLSSINLQPLTTNN
jgi:hypothetical protein